MLQRVLNERRKENPPFPSIQGGSNLAKRTQRSVLQLKQEMVSGKWREGTHLGLYVSMDRDDDQYGMDRRGGR